MANTNELYHFGIKGQRWGVRRYEDASGHLTPAGKARYNDYERAKGEAKKAKEAYTSAKQKANESWDQKDIKAANKATGMYYLKSKQASDAKAKFKLNERSEAGKKAGKREQALIEKYKEKGMTQEEAEIAAYKRAKLEKALIAAGAVTVTAAALYGAKKYHDYVTDEVLEVGKTKMKRVTSDSTNDLHDTFYAAFGKGDANKYVGMYGNQLKGQGNSDIYQKTINLKENIKIASDKNAKDVMADVMRKTSPENRREILDGLNDMNRMYQRIPMLKYSKQGRMLNKGLNDIANGRYDTKAAYDALNFNMSGGNQSKVYGEFKQALKNKGYSGIKDRNDAKYSGYDAKTARIIFDNSKVEVSNVRKLSDTEINDKLGNEAMKMAIKSLGKGAVLAGALSGVSKGLEARSVQKENTKAIAEYKKEHPGTKLSNDEILENYYGGKK